MMEQSVPCAYTIFITIITVHMFFSDYLPPCLISLNNPDPQCACEHNQLVGETSLPAGSAPTAPRHISIPSSRRIAPFILMTHRRVSGVMDDDNMYGRAPVFRCLNCVKKMPHERESQSFPLRPAQPHLHIGGICFDLARCPKPHQTSDKMHSQYLYSSTAHCKDLSESS